MPSILQMIPSEYVKHFFYLPKTYRNKKMFAISIIILVLFSLWLNTKTKIHHTKTIENGFSPWNQSTYALGIHERKNFEIQ